MKDKTRTTLPASVRSRALKAIAVVDDWNNAVTHARAAEILAGCLGLFEHALIDDPRWGQNNLAIHTLDLLEETVQKQGWTLEQFYRAVGVRRPTAIVQSDDVMDWRGMGPR
jgi:hypothetical protein